MGGFIFRMSVRFKDRGERLHWDRLIRLGLRLKEWVMKHGKVK